MATNEEKYIREYRKEASKYISDEAIASQLFILDDKKREISKLREQNGPLSEKIVITINGTPRAGKTTCVDNLHEFFKKANLKTANLVEPAGLVYQTLRSKEEKMELLKDRVEFVGRQYNIGRTDIENNLDGHDIIICDRGVLDTYVWYDMYYKMGMMDRDEYLGFLRTLKQRFPYQNRLYSLYATTDVSLYRDYKSSLSIEPRTTMNRNNIERYNDSLVRLGQDDFAKYLDNYAFIDTDNCGMLEPSIQIANEIMDEVKNMYLRKVN